MEFFSWTALGSLGGAVGAVTVVTNTIRRLTKLDSPAVPFAVCLGVVFGTWIANGAAHPLSGVIISFLNSCLLFCAALGVNDSLVSAVQPAGRVTLHGTRPVRWWQTWLRRTDLAREQAWDGS
jgi:hypothetical protein